MRCDETGKMKRRTRQILATRLVAPQGGSLRPTLLVVGLRVVWGYVADYRLTALVAKLRAAGVWLKPEDFPDGAQVPAGENAVSALFTDVWNPQFPYGWSSRTESADKLTAADRVKVRGYVSEEQGRMDQIDAAGLRPKIAWPRQIFSVGNISWPSHYEMGANTALANLMCLTAEMAHDEGDDESAIRYLTRVMVLARILESFPITNDFFIAYERRDQVSRGVDYMERSLRLENPAVSTEVHRLIQLMQDHHEEYTSMAWQGMMAFDLAVFYATKARRGPLIENTELIVAEPMSYDMDAADDSSDGPTS